VSPVDLSARRTRVYELGHGVAVSFWRPPGRDEPVECDRCGCDVDESSRGAWMCQPTEVGQRSMDSTPRWLCEDCHAGFVAWMGAV